MTRGILATAYLHPRAGAGVDDVAAAFREICAAHPLLRYDEEPPPTKSVTGTNLAAVNVSAQDGVAVVTCAVDNLVRGAGGQGIQAMNIRFGLEPAAGLPVRPTWP